jgi:WD40 repeat protein
VEQLEQFLHWKAPEARPEAQPILVSESSPLRFDEAHWEVRVTQAGDTAHVSVWDTEKNVELGSIPKVSRLVRDGSRKRVAICQWASAGLWLFDAGEGGAPRRFGSGEQDGCWDVSWGEEDKWLATGSNDSHAYVYSAVAQPKLLWKIKHKAPVHRVAMHPKYRLLATGDVLGNVSIWELSQSTGELSHSKRPPDNLVASPQGNWSCIHHLLWSPDGSRLFSATAMGRWQLWSRHPSGKWYMQTSMSFTDPLIHPLPLTAVSFSPDSRYVFTVGADNMVRRYPVDLDTLTGCVAALPWRNQLSVVERTRYLQNGAQRWSLPPGPTVSGDESAEFGSSATDLRRAGGWGKRGSAH